MKERLLLDLKEALKSKNISEKNTIQLIRASILNEEKNKQIELDNLQIEELIAKELKKRNDSLVEFTKANRQDLTNQTNEEIEILKRYLPKQLTINEIENIWEENKEEIKLNGWNIGSAMKILKSIIGTKFGGKELSEFIKNKLN